MGQGTSALLCAVSHDKGHGLIERFRRSGFSLGTRGSGLRKARTRGARDTTFTEDASLVRQGSRQPKVRCVSMS